jgi:hypothetical protein
VEMAAQKTMPKYNTGFPLHCWDIWKSPNPVEQQKNCINYWTEYYLILIE